MLTEDHCQVKVAYVMRLSLDQLDGVGRKVRDQLEAWRRLGVDARIIALVNVPGNEMNTVQGWFFDLAPASEKWLKRKTQRLIQYVKLAWRIYKWSPDVIYTRAGDSHWGELLWRGSGAKRVVELNATIESEIVSLQRAGTIDENESRARQAAWAKTMSAADGYVSVSYEIERQNEALMQQKPRTVVWNAIAFSKYENIQRTNGTNALPKVVFVGAADYEWNGLDKLLDLAITTVGKLEIVIIGLSPNDDVPENVTVYPFLGKDELPRVIASCDVGMATLALHRKGLTEASPLKVREYASLGLPMIISYDETPFENNDFPEWILSIPNSETAVTSNIETILEFVEKWRGASFDRELAKPYFDTVSVEQRRVRFFNKIKMNN